ncbi:unnamed protein product [Aureobasidium uvarum]|uniref:Uncharacterized protein n=1 Tax=Aureobasidium uvarum TaxID=2773716 RepID=A0A9N8KRD6_9PEZI|nr:unnamed protein product [Aureobasidium uvarum]
MAPFALFTHRSFRRGPSSQSTSASDSATTQQKTAMGGMPSKAATNVNEAPHKKLRPRSSSMHLLKRNRDPSGHNAARTSTLAQPLASADTTTIEVSESEADYTRISLARRSDSQSTVKTLSDSVHSNRYEFTKHDSFESDASSTRTATRVTRPSEALLVLGADDEPNGMSTPIPPHPPKTPQIRLPTPPFLTEDSPTKYGLRMNHSPSPDRSMVAKQRQKMTGAGLFVVTGHPHLLPSMTARLTTSQHAATQQRSTTLTLPVDQARSGATNPTQSFAHSSPSLPMSDKANPTPDHSTSLPIHRMPLRLSQPFKDAPQEHVAHALPLRTSQTTCYREHDIWQRMGSNYRYPVACTICDGYEPPGDDFMTCLWCEVHVCGQCYAAFVKNGLAGMMERKQR